MSRCVVCDQEIRFTTRPRYVCCNGQDCGCYGGTLPHDICSLACYEEQQISECSQSIKESKQ